MKCLTMSDNGNQSNPWTNLSTITTFDSGNSARTTRRVEETQDGASGGQIVGRVGPSTSLLIESLIKSICTMLESDPTRRNKLYFTLCDKLHGMRLIDSSYNMLEFEGIRGQYQQAWYHLVAVARAAAGGDSILEIPNPTGIIPESSRYSHDFDELEFIASGGFGNVYRALHRLDGHEYAIKKIIVRSSRIKTIVQQLKEVKTLAKLNHTNIVAYKAAWIEYDLPRSLNSQYLTEKRARSSSRSKKSVISSVSYVESNTNYSSQNQLSNNTSSNHNKNDTDSPTGMYVKNYLKHQINHLNNKISIELSIINCDITIQQERFQQFNTTIDIIGRRIDEIDGTTGEKQNSDIVSFRNDDDDYDDINNDDNDKSVSSSCSYEIEEINCDDRDATGVDQVADRRICQYNSSTLRPQFATLYIQMALCEKTLRTWLDERLEATPEPITTMILTQILDGLHYIHSRRTVHHDIKPSNIFIGPSGQRVEIQLGDFGLACPLQRESHHPVLGTELYAAPEQLSGLCDPKVSMDPFIFFGISPFKGYIFVRNGLVNGFPTSEMKRRPTIHEYFNSHPNLIESHIDGEVTKSDLYSLGIVIFEILFPMKTHMERNSLINQLKSGKIPESFIDDYPKWADIIKKLVHADPKRRPSTIDLLQSLREDKDVLITKLRDHDKKQKVIIENLKRENDELREEIDKLKAKIHSRLL